MSKAEDQLNQAKILHQSGFTAFQNKAYKESIDYFKRAKVLGLDFIDNADADRFIGSAYLELKKGGLARKYLRRATASGMLSTNSIFMLARAEEKRCWLYKLLLGDSHTEKVEELLDWYLLGHELPDQNSLSFVALNAYNNQKWHKAIVLYDTLKGFDKTNIQYQTYSILSLYNAGELFRARVEIENLFSNILLPIEDLLATRAELSMIFGDFKQAKDYYSLSKQGNLKDIKPLLQALDVYSRAGDISEDFRTKALYFFIKGYNSTSYIASIDNIEHFELMLSAITAYLEHHQIKQTENAKKLLDDSKKQFQSAYESHSQQPKVELLKPPKPAERLTPWERILKHQMSDMSAAKELIKMNAIMNTMWNFSFTNQFDNQIWKSGILLKVGVWLNRGLLFIFKAFLFILASIGFVDGIYSAIFGESLLSIPFPSISASSTPAVIKVLFGVTWFLFIFFIDTVLEKKINHIIVNALRSTLVNYTKQITYTLVAGEAAYEFLLASQPIPHLDMNVKDLLEIGLGANKPWEVRLHALIMAGSKANSSEILPFKERLIAELSPDNNKFRLVSAILLAIGKSQEALPIIENELKNEKNEINNDTVFLLALKSLAKYGDQSSAAILRDFVIYNVENSMEVFRGIEAIKILPLELRISTVIEILEANTGKGNEYALFLGVLNGLGNPAVNPLITFYNTHHKEIFGLDIILAMLNTGSEIGYNAVKNWLAGSELAQSSDASELDDMRYEFLIANKKFELISDIAFDENLSVGARKKAAYYIAFLEKEKLQDVAFRLWRNDDSSEVYVKTLGDIGTPACAEKLGAFLEKSRDAIDDTIGKTEYTHIYSALALCGEAGKRKLIDLANNTRSLKVERLFALAALYGTNQSVFANLRKLKKALSDKDINEYHRSHVFWITDWCVRRGDEIEFKLFQHRKPSPVKYYRFLKWASQNSKLPEQVHVMAEFALSSSSFKEYDRELFLPKSYNRIEVFLGKMKSKFSEKKQ